MYDLIDRPIADLPAFERAVVESTRRWVHAYSTAGARAIVGEATALSDAMRALDRGSAADIVIPRPCFATVEETEAVIVGLWRLVRDGRSDAAYALAGALVDDDHVDALLGGIARAIAAGR